jgi:hypothetical protein
MPLAVPRWKARFFGRMAVLQRLGMDKHFASLRLALRLKKPHTPARPTGS